MMTIDLSSFNPLRLRGAAVPPELVLIARTLTLVLLLLPNLPFTRYLPYFEFMDRLGSAAMFDGLVLAAAAGGAGILLFSSRVRLGCLLLGCAYLTGLIASRPSQSVAHTYVACMFLVIGMSSQASGTKLLRAQVVILYVGAAINKAFDPDWWNGRYFETLMVDRHAHGLYIWASSMFPPLALSTVMGVSTIASEVAIAVCLLRRRLYAYGVVLGVVFHGAMVILLNQTFGPFVAAVLLSYVAFFPWFDQVTIATGSHAFARPLAWLLTALDFDRRFDVRRPAESIDFEVAAHGRRFVGLASVRALLLSTPIAYVSLAVLLTTDWSSGLARSVTVALLMAGALHAVVSATVRNNRSA